MTEKSALAVHPSHRNRNALHCQPQESKLVRENMEQNEMTLVIDKRKQNKLSEEEEAQEEEEEEINIYGWIHLPDDILELIMRRLCLADYLGLRAVCSPWRATIVNAIANKHCHPLPELPLVVLRYFYKVTRFFSLSTACVFHRKTPLLEGNQFCHGSVEGWMIVCDHRDKSRHNSILVFFLNPVTNARVYVPPMLNYPSDSPLKGDQLSIGKMVASSKPDSSSCFLVSLFTDFCHIAFCGLSDKSWTMIGKEHEYHFMDVEIFGSKLYVRTDKSMNCIMVYDLQDSSGGDPPKPKLLALLPPVRPPPVSSIIGNRRFLWGTVIAFLAKDDALQELLLIYMHSDAVHDTERVGYLNLVTEFVSPPQVTAIEVFKLCLSNNETNNQFVKVDNLGDRVLFLGSCKSIVMSSAAFNSNEELFAANCIYFAVNYRCPANPWDGFQLGIFCLDDNSIQYYSIEKSDECKPPYPLWFVPSLW